jgi:hypothetical protein
MIVEDSLIDWCLAHTLAVFQLYRSVEMIYKSISSRLSKRLQKKNAKPLRFESTAEFYLFYNVTQIVHKDLNVNEKWD